jgi:hypothetical chaperone protein
MRPIMSASPFTLGLDFGTTNSVAATARGDAADLVMLDGPEGPDAIFRSALCFWEGEGDRGGLASDAGPWAIKEYLSFPQESRFIQSFKSVAAMASFEHASIFTKRYRFEELGRLFLERMIARMQAAGWTRGPRGSSSGRPVEYAGSRPDEALARQRYDLPCSRDSAPRFIMSTNRSARRSAMPVAHHRSGDDPGRGFRRRHQRFLGRAGRSAGRGAALRHRWAMPASALRATGSIIGSSITSSCRCSARAVLQARSIRCWRYHGGYFNDFADWSRLALMRNRKDAGGPRETASRRRSIPMRSAG